eukprot:13315716-Alexandrium_andersonii.AAC.1
MEEATAPAGPRVLVQVLVPRSEAAEFGDPFQLQLWVRGAPREARRPWRAAPKPPGSPMSSGSELGPRTFRS